MKQSLGSAALNSVLWLSLTAFLSSLIVRRLQIDEAAAALLLVDYVTAFSLMTMAAVLICCCRMRATRFYELMMAAVIFCACFLAGGALGWVNLVFVLSFLLSFWFASSIGSLLHLKSTILFIRVSIVVFVAILIAASVFFTLSTSYMGDYRGERFLFGFRTPHQAAEVFMVAIFMLTALVLLGGMSRWMACVLIAPFLLGISLTASRGPVVALLVFFVLFLSSYIPEKYRLVVRLSLVLVAFATILFLAFFYSSFFLFSFDDINQLSSSRLLSWRAEIVGNLDSLEKVLFGNFDAKYYFIYPASDARSDKIQFHVDGFYIERLIVSGIVGIFVSLGVIYSFFRLQSAFGRSIVVAMLVYGLFETVIFSLHSFTGLAPLVLASLVTRHSNGVPGWKPPLAVGTSRQPNNLRSRHPIQVRRTHNE